MACYNFQDGKLYGISGLDHNQVVVFKRLIGMPFKLIENVPPTGVECYCTSLLDHIPPGELKDTIKL
jgi:hypothetical protein